MGMPKVDGHAYEKQQVQGHTLNNRTVAMLTDVESRLGYDLTVLQGSYNAGGVSQSAGTHDGGGAVDLAPYDWKNKVAALRRVGFAPGTARDPRHMGRAHPRHRLRRPRPLTRRRRADRRLPEPPRRARRHATTTRRRPPQAHDFDYQAFRQEQRQSELRAQRRRKPRSSTPSRRWSGCGS
jgi:hypothetical protein